MEIKIKRLSSVEKELGVKLTEKEVSLLKENVYQDWKSKAEIPGYRKGKAPLELVLQKYKSSIEQDLKDSIGTAFYKKVIQELNITPITVPVINKIDLTSDGGSAFTLKVEEKPLLKLPKYKGLKYSKKIVAVSDEHIQKVLQDLQKEKTEWLDVERRAQEGDFVILDLEVFSEGKVLDKQENSAFLLETNELFSELLDSLKGLSKGESKEFSLDVPSGFKNKKIAGKRCDFKVRLKAVKEKKEPQIDAAFAKKVGNYQSLEDLKKAIAEELKSFIERQSELEMEAKLLEELIAKSNFELPPRLLKMQAEKVAQDIVWKLAYQKVPEDEIKKQIDSIWKSAEKEAEKQLRIYFILEEIAEKESITVTPEEVEKEIERLAQNNKTSREEFRKKLEEKGEFDNIKDSLKRQKAVQLIKENAEIKEVQNAG